MSSVCISNCVNDTHDPRVPVRANYMNLHKWPKSDAEFIKLARRVSQGMHEGPRVVDSISCRQMYLRSYTFSRKESVPEKTQKCFGRVKEKVGINSNYDKKSNKKKKINSSKNYNYKGDNGQKTSQQKKKSNLVFRKVKEISCGALFRIFHRLLSCGASVDVVDQND